MFPEMTKINGFENYYVTRDGKIFSNMVGKGLVELKLREDKDGYYEIGLYSNRKRYFRRIHRLVGVAYIPNPNNYPQINHKDGNVKNNNVENLEWCTALDNIRHSYRELKRVQKPTTNKIIRVIEKSTSKEMTFNSIKDFARFLKMSHEHLGRVLSGKNDIGKCKKLKPYIVTFIE